MEKELLEELYRRYGQEIYRYLYAICRDRFLAEDILQDAFCKAILSLPSGHVNARAWFYMTGRNLLLNEMKKRKRHIYSEEPEAQAAARAGSGGGIPGGDPEEETVRREESSCLRQALLSLDLRKREILILNYFENFTLKEAAVIMGISYENARILSYDDFIRFTEKYSERAGDIWCAPRTAEGSHMPNGRPANLGFYVTLGQTSMLEWDREKYPDLILRAVDELAEWDEAEEKIKDGEYAAEHFAVMLDYMSEQDGFLRMIRQQEPEMYADAADYIRDNGLQVYGFACRADKETLLELNAEEEVFGMRVEEVD